ncbi:MAG: histidine--tRNA ligase [Patescibacteria group bacterium]|nr:histidine--tRNA ligase [Patescibacteria group bacterium]
MGNITAQTLKGFRDFLPRESGKRQYVQNLLKQVFESFGFEPLETPALEYEEILLGKYGDEGDKLMYRFTDQGGRRVALRYDQTVPLARVVAQYQNQLPIPFKRYQIQPVWRAENPQRGRFREFLQCDIDTVGLNSPLSDAEVIACTIKSLETLGFKNFKAIINDRTIFSDLVNNAIFKDYNLFSIIRIVDKLNKIGYEEVIDELTEKITSGDESSATSILCTLEDSKPTQNLKDIFKALEEELGISKEKYEFSPTLARGLDYYTGLIFEVEIEGYTAGSVGGGGRYDNLIGLFSKQTVPAVGFAFGFDRLIEVMDQLGLFPADLTTSQVLVTIFSKDLEQKSAEVASCLRSNNINTELWLDPQSKLDKQLKYANQKGIPFVVIIGPNEVQENKVTLKDLKNKSQQTISLDEAIQKLTL